MSAIGLHVGLELLVFEKLSMPLEDPRICNRLELKEVTTAKQVQSAVWQLFALDLFESEVDRIIHCLLIKEVSSMISSFTLRLSTCNVLSWSLGNGQYRNPDLKLILRAECDMSP